MKESKYKILDFFVKTQGIKRYIVVDAETLIPESEPTTRSLCMQLIKEFEANDKLDIYKGKKASYNEYIRNGETK